MRIALAQIDPTVGDLKGNSELIIRRAREARGAAADVVVFPELCVCGYPPEDLVIKDYFVADCRWRFARQEGRATPGLHS